jgi:hypothetical protein
MSTLSSFTKSCTPSSSVGSLWWMVFSFDSIDKVGVRWLQRDFGGREVWEVVKAMNGNKVLGLDGYSLAFFQAC